MSIAIDERGFPVLLSSGNSTKDLSSRAAAVDTTSSDVKVSTSPVSVNPLEWARRRDAVRDAAREFEDLSDQDLRERLRGATSRTLTPAEVAQFTADVRSQVLDDLVDVLDQNRRGKLRARRTVRVVAPRGYTRRTLGGLSADERSQVEDRLRARGWTDTDVHAVLGSKNPPA